VLRHRFRPRQYAPRPLRVAPPPAPMLDGAALPSIAIVTPSYEQAAYLERAIRSVVRQGYPRLRYAVADGGSRDGSVAVIERWAPHLAAWSSAPDGGQGAAVNRAFATLDGEVMAWLNSDDLLLPGTLRVVGEFFARHPDVDVVYGNRIVIDDADCDIGRWIVPGHDDAGLAWADVVPQETLFWRRRVWTAVGGLDPTFRFALDWDLLLRWRAAGARFAHLPRFLGAFRLHGAQKNAVIGEVGRREMQQLRARTLGRAPSSAAVRWRILPLALRAAWAGLRFDRDRAAGRIVELPYEDAAALEAPGIVGTRRV
jgi:hypothetical protein